jgi:Protein of unknown function (DUF2892)
MGLVEFAMINIGSVDRALRFAVGTALLIAPLLPLSSPFFAGGGAWAYAAMAVGLVMIGTAIFRFCPAYALFGIRTCRTGDH